MVYYSKLKLMEVKKWTQSLGISQNQFGLEL